MTKYIIYCAKQGDKWKEENSPRHLLAVENKPIIARTAEQLHLNDPDCEIIIVCSPGQPVNIHYSSIEVSYPDEKLNGLDSFINTKNRWNVEGRTVCLMGDTYYTDEAIKTIVEDTSDDVTFYGRKGWNKYGVTNRDSIFGYSFFTKDHNTISNSITEAIRKNNSNTVKNIYEECEGCKWTVINDLTQDIDIPHDYNVLMNTIELIRR